MSGGYGEPDWLSPSSPGAAVPPPAAAHNSHAEFATTSGNAASGGGLTAAEAKADNSKCAQTFLSILNLLIAALMIFLGVKGVLLAISNIEENVADAIDIPFFFVLGYIFIFAGILILYELLWWFKIAALNKALRKNFGFMYGIRGKGFYEIFVAFLVVGFDDADSLKTLMWITGIAWLVAGGLHIFLWYWRPHLVESYKSPTHGFADTQNAV